MYKFITHVLINQSHFNMIRELDHLVSHYVLFSLFIYTFNFLLLIFYHVIN
jgi:hypothetical protein